MSMNDLPPPPPNDPYLRPMPDRAVDGVPVGTRAAAAASVKGPAIILIVAASLGVLMSLMNVIFSIVMTPERMQEMVKSFIPNAPPGAFAGLDANQTVNIVSGVLFLLLNGFVLFGAVQALRLRMWPIAFAACIAAMVNIGSCCCILTLPFGIWLLVVLLKPDVKAVFDRS